ncbi:MAG TPA: hypothetical protein PKD99_02805 [Sphingopyxis sp.]|nr:hypothetical protein [Sphingopyxis sp.]HMP44009.1 hypothetical protein [Sphingopyxis sp.]HMQ20073.1 hypothetical protein [Sphingopyxis sp.]
MIRRDHGYGPLAGLAMAMLAGCAAHGAEPSATAATEPASRAVRLADDLVAADAAFDAGDKPALVSALNRIGRRNARPLDAEAPDPVAGWRAAVPGEVPPLRGRALGPGYVRGTLDPGAATSTDQLFLSGQAATVAADARPEKDLRLRIYDAEGKLVCDRSPVHGRDCRFTPVFTQRYRIELHNGGTKSARYYLVLD